MIQGMSLRSVERACRYWQTQMIAKTDLVERDNAGLPREGLRARDYPKSRRQGEMLRKRCDYLPSPPAETTRLRLDTRFPGL